MMDLLVRFGKYLQKQSLCMGLFGDVLEKAANGSLRGDGEFLDIFDKEVERQKEWIQQQKNAELRKKYGSRFQETQ